jgi:DNA-binding helix-hairpin-helix protein with protein kinase domain
MSEAKTVVDRNGARYQLVRCLGEGGQGKVYEVAGGRLAVKLLNPAKGLDLRRLDHQFSHLRTLEGFPIAKPIAILAPPHIGYVMKLLSKQCPLKHLMTPPKDVASLLDWYHKTGGIKRRLRALRGAAAAIAMLHARGMCYGDVSPSNIFIDESPASDVVSLIDVDNLRYETTPADGAIYTPLYGAPELVSGTTVPSSMTDAHSLAILIFETLVMTHPLLGDMVEQGDPDLETQACMGELPWIDHPTDASNRSSRGITERKWVLSPKLRQLAAMAFGPGLKDVRVRPTATEWAEVLDRAARNCLTCAAGGCDAAFYLTERTCPRCGSPRKPFLYGRLQSWDPSQTDGRGGPIVDPEGKPRMIDSFVISSGERLVVNRRLTAGASFSSSATDHVAIELSMDDVVIENLDPTEEIRWRSTSPARRGTLAGRDRLRIPRSEIPTREFHFGPSESIHRVLFLKCEE